MTSREVVQLTSDVSGRAAQETVTFSVGGTSYEIDLTADEAAVLREDFDRYVAVARTAGPGAGDARDLRRPAPVTDYNPRAVRAWAAGRGIDVSDRGRLSKAVLELYRRTVR